VADVRAPTPSIAAEIISKTQFNLNSNIELLQLNNKLFTQYITTKLLEFKLKFLRLKNISYKKILIMNKNNINLIDFKLKNHISNRLNLFKSNLEKLKISVKNYNSSRYNSMILKNNICIKSIDEIINNNSGKFKIILNNQEINVKIKVI